MKNKILFVIDSLRIGGVQSALINLLQAIDCTKFDISLLLFHFEEEYLSIIPNKITILKMPFVIDAMNMTKDSAKRKGLLTYFMKLLGAISCRIFGSKATYNVLFKTLNKIKEEFDVAISFTNNLDSNSTYFGCNQFVLNHIKAAHKASWLHVDYDAMGMNNPINNEEYSRFDRIIHVSEACKSSFVKFNPALENRSVVAYNIINPDIIKSKSVNHNFMVQSKKNLKIITIARIDKNKNVSACVNIAKRLKESRIPFLWLILGDGQDKKEIEKQIYEEGLSDCMQLNGYISNPYPYITHSDILVSTSLSESFGMVIYESTVLGIPVIAYNYPALEEIVKDGFNGFRCETEEDIFNKIITLHSNRALYEKIKNSCKPIIEYGKMLEMNIKAITF